MENNTIKFSKKLPTFRVSGGLGKHIMFSTLLPAITKKYGKINIISPYTEVFINNKNIEHSIFIDDFENNKSVYKEGISKIYAYEPYSCEFSFDDKHILESWIEAYDLDRKYISTPKVYVPEEIKADAKEIISKLKNDFKDGYIIVQFSGGQSPVGFDPEKSQYNINNMVIERNYPQQMAQILINKIKDKYPNMGIINCSLPNEYNFDNVIRIERGFLHYFEFVQKAKTVICIDSMLQHISSTTDTKTIVLWNNKAWNPSHKYGWNLDNFTNIEGPNMCIDYDEVLELI